MHKKIFIIDDDDMFVRYIKEAFYEKSIDCTHIRSADEVVVNIATLNSTDCVLLDIMMPSGSSSVFDDAKPNIETGEVLYQIIRNAYPEKLVVILTNIDADKIDSNIMRDHHVKYLSKTNKFQDIVGSIIKFGG